MKQYCVLRIIIFFLFCCLFSEKKHFAFIYPTFRSCLLWILLLKAKRVRKVKSHMYKIIIDVQQFLFLTFNLFILVACYLGSLERFSKIDHKFNEYITVPMPLNNMIIRVANNSETSGVSPDMDTYLLDHRPFLSSQIRSQSLWFISS